MLLFQGVCGFKFTRQKKPTSDGLKMWQLCESKTGFVVNAILDLRTKTTLHDMILQLSSVVSGEWRTIYMDNLFTSVQTFNALHSMSILACGTVRAGRGLPLWLEKGQKSVQSPGEVVWSYGEMRDGGHVLGSIWFDSGECCLLSTRHRANVFNVKRKVAGSSQRVDRASLKAYEDYNKFMGGVDLADQKRSMLTCRRRSYKWYWAVIWWLLDSAVINANVVRDAKCAELGMKKCVNREFMEDLVEDLRFEAQQTKIEQLVRQQVASGLPDRLIFRHFECNFEKRGACVVCKQDKKVRKTTSIYHGCEQCGLHMHHECFKAYHTQQHPKSGKFE
jgi:ribosomal protein L37AE/L43A